MLYVAALLLYPLSFGPVRYGVQRGKIDPATYATLYQPIDSLLGYDKPWNLFRRHVLWWYGLALKQEWEEIKQQGVTPGPLTPSLHR